MTGGAITPSIFTTVYGSDDAPMESMQKVADWPTVQQVLDCHAQFGRLDREKVKSGMGPNWPPEWDAFGPGEAIWEPAGPR